ncbi:hypothetical protein PVK06_026951 [Gossypium arboreum]|uniref:Uncharacterized protein n=1 Tax=Gossypium arboreum TaxID=29729 RepID=A0ABR0P1I7_GOSAR|nr:hypothetical protein PVK06_026951 [Gossypium arboreum]
MRVVDKLDNYLGLPIPVGKKKTIDFHSIINCFSCRINSWSKRLLSYDGHELLSMYAKISSIRQDFKKKCSWYNAKEETVIQSLKDYPTARIILALEGLDNKVLIGEYSCCIDWIKDVMRVLDMKVVANFITTFWSSWNNCNNFIFWGKEDDARFVWDRENTL